MVENASQAGLRAGELRVWGSRRLPGRLRVCGELGLGTRERLRAVPGERDDRHGDLDIDASELWFVDCAPSRTGRAGARSTRRRSQLHERPLAAGRAPWEDRGPGRRSVCTTTI